MKHLLWATVILICLAFTGKTSVRQFRWLQGSWHVQDKDIHESWKFVNDSILAGVSYHHDEDGEEKVDEVIKLVFRNGSFYYIPMLPDKNKGKEIEFKIVSATKNSFVAENLQHDYPQRIVYQLQDSVHLLSYIEGPDKGKNRRFDFNFIKGK
jgi:hypothetical protein